MRAILICPNYDLRGKFIEAVVEHPNIFFSQILDSYPSRDLLRRAVCACAPELIFLDIGDAGAAECVARQMERDFPAIQRVALHQSQDTSIFRRVLQLRMRELLSPPFSSAETGIIFDRLHEELIANPVTIGATKHLYAFLPAKAGSGTSTIAANATWAFAQTQEHNVLLADFDTSSGVTGFMFRVEHEHGLAAAAAHASEFDSETWDRVVKRLGNIDLLLSGAPNMGEAISARQLARLIEFSRRNYDVINVDLPEALSETSLAVLQEASQAFLVTTPDLPALRMARLKAALLRKLGLQDKLSLVLNRVSKRSALDVKEIELTIGLPVFKSFPCDYANVTAAIQAGRPASRLSGAARDFAEKLLDPSRQPPERKAFLEEFAIAPLHFAFR